MDHRRHDLHSRGRGRPEDVEEEFGQQEVTEVDHCDGRLGSVLGVLEVTAHVHYASVAREPVEAVVLGGERGDELADRLKVGEVESHDLMRSAKAGISVTTAHHRRWQVGTHQRAQTRETVPAARRGAQIDHTDLQSLTGPAVRMSHQRAVPTRTLTHDITPLPEHRRHLTPPRHPGLLRQRT